VGKQAWQRRAYDVDVCVEDILRLEDVKEYEEGPNFSILDGEGERGKARYLNNRVPSSYATQ